MTASFCMSTATSMLWRQAGTRRRSKTVAPDGQFALRLHVAGHRLGGEQLGADHGHQRHRVVDVNPLQAELLAVAAEGRRQESAASSRPTRVDSSGSWLNRS